MKYWNRIFVPSFFLAAGLLQAGDLSKLQQKVSLSPARLAERLAVVERPTSNYLPAHLRYSFDEDRLSDGVIYRERQILVIPIDDYRTLFRGRERRKFDLQLGFLKEIVNRGIGEHVRVIPVFPPTPEGQIFHAQEEYMLFEGGRGVRFITRFGPEKSLNTNDNLFYTFQGFSKNGKTLIVFFHPISVRNLPISEDAGISALYMNQQDPDRFTPNLNALDQVIRDIQIRK